jgi:hypothetical protein
MRLAAMIFLVGLAGCGVEPLPRLQLADPEARCGHLRQTAPAVFADCVRSVEFGNELRIESRQRYLRQQAEDWQPAPTYFAPTPYVPPPTFSTTAPAAPTPMPPVAPFVPPAETPHVLCVGQVAIPGGSNAEGMRIGCQ